MSISNTCKLTCVDNGTTLDADILDFRHKINMSVVVRATMRIQLSWNEKTNRYVGKAAGLEFESLGPTEY